MHRIQYVISVLVLLFTVLYACQGEDTIRIAQYAINGQKIYNTHCQNCHGEKGEGLGNLYPPLTDTVFLSDNKDILPCIIKYGSSRQLTVSGKQFNTAMPASNLSDIDIAYVITYIRTRLNTQKEGADLQKVQENLSRCSVNK